MARLGLTLTALSHASTETGELEFISAGLTKADCTELLPMEFTKRVLTVWPFQDTPSTFRSLPPRGVKLPALRGLLVRLVQTLAPIRKSCDCKLTIRSPSI